MKSVTQNASCLSVTTGLDYLDLEVDLGFAASETILGPIIGLLALILAVCWRVTTPVLAPELSRGPLR